METKRKRSNTPVDNTPLPTTFREIDPIIKDLDDDKWAGLSDDEIKDICNNE